MEKPKREQIPGAQVGCKQALSIIDAVRATLALQPTQTRTQKDQAMKFKILFHPAEEGGFWAEIPGLPGCISEGGDLDETLANIREAAEGWIAVATDKSGISGE